MHSFVKHSLSPSLTVPLYKTLIWGQVSIHSSSFQRITGRVQNPRNGCVIGTCSVLNSVSALPPNKSRGLWCNQKARRSMQLVQRKMGLRCFIPSLRPFFLSLHRSTIQLSKTWSLG